MFGEQLYNLLNKGEADPRLALMAALGLGSTSGTPMAGGDTSAPVGTGTGTTAPAAPQQPAAYQSPPQIMQLYQQMMERQKRIDGINQSIGLIFSSFARPESRAGILAATRGGGSGDTMLAGGGDFLTKILEFQQRNAEIQQKAATRAGVPEIGKRYGLDPATALYLFDVGELDDVIKEAAKPNKQLQQLADGTYAIIDLTDGSVSDPIGPKKPREIEIVEDPMGNKFAVDKATGQRIGSENIAEGMGSHEISRLWRETNADRKARGQEEISLEEFIKQYNAGRQPKTEIKLPGKESESLVGELEKDYSDSIFEGYATARSARRVIDDVNVAREKLDSGIIAGSMLSPLELQGRKAWADIMGIPDEAAETTEAFQASLKETVLSKIKALGSGTAISDADRRFIEQAVGGDITLTEGAMRQIFDILEKGARNVVEGYNKDVDDLINSFEDEKDKKRLQRMLRRIELPEKKKAAADNEEAPIEDLLKKYLEGE